MQVSGKILVLATVSISVLMAAGSWWYNYNQSRRAAQFWGREAAALLVASDKVQLLDLVNLLPKAGEEGVAGSTITKTVDLTGKPGLVHLRHALTYDGNFEWDRQRHVDTITNFNNWRYALRFSRGDRRLVVLFDPEFQQLAKVVEAPWSEDSPYHTTTLDILPCPELGPVIIRYLSKSDVGAIAPAAEE